MKKISALLALAAVLPVLFVSIGSSAAQVQYYYETVFVGAVPPVTANEAAVVSAWESPAALQGLFADFFSSAGQPANAVHAAALDGWAAYWNGFNTCPTGCLSVAKNAGGINGIETYSGINPAIQWELTQDLHSTPPPASWLTVTASLNPVQAMDFATGTLPPGAMPLQTDYIITAESLLGNLWLGAYAITNQFGFAVTPYLVSAFNTQRQTNCLGLTVSNGKPGPSGPWHWNDVVFVDFDPVTSRMVAHAVSFNIWGAAFGQLDNPLQVSFQVPWDLTFAGTSIAGIWITRNAATYSSITPPPIVSHDVGISIPNPALPNTQPGSFAILRDVLTISPPQLPNTLVANYGGGPISHVPVGDLRGNPPPMPVPSPSQQLFGWNWGLGLPGNRPGPFGWYVVTPGWWFGSAVVHAIDTNGSPSAAVPWGVVHFLPGGAVANGSPLAHPGYIGISGNNNLRPGVLWVPYRTQQNTYLIDMLDGIGFAVWTPGIPHMVAGANFPLLAPLPLRGLAWPASTILRDQKTNWKADHGNCYIGF
jgi:hypothetical protein